MGFSPTAVATLNTVDTQAPGAPGLAVQQLSNSQGQFTLTFPTADADGSPLSGLTYADAVMIQGDELVAEAFVNNFDGALALPGAQVFRFAAGEAPVIQTFGIAAAGTAYSVLARCADHPAPAVF